MSDNIHPSGSVLWHVKQAIQAVLARRLGAYDDDIHIADGFPLPVCAFRRAPYAKLFKQHVWNTVIVPQKGKLTLVFKV